MALLAGGCGEEKKKRRHADEPEASSGPGLAETYALRSKTSEARNTLGAIARASVAAYERESGELDGAVAHALCKSSTPVPLEVPKGDRYQPKPADFEAGDAKTGWKCLKFAMTEPFRYRYEYRSAPPWKGTARGGPDPGPNGFEITAEGDLDGDGKTSLFVLTGKVEGDAVKIATTVFVADELE